MFLYRDWPLLAAGSESGRSSPYYGQEGRSSTPTTNQPPKHFHVPGRTPHLTAEPLHTLTSSAAKPFRVPIRMCWSVIRLYITVQHIITLAYSSPHAASLPSFIFLPNHSPPYSFSSPVCQPSSNSQPLLLHSSMFHLFISSVSPQPQGTPTSTGSLPSIRELVQCS